ncbi:MAG: 1-(5-phosphoribosyl)-5-[(5-phosphoribosylamino)methylideneamino] imidazole-4-carboxamide isomerase, partial [Rhodobacteraceae bacterium]|nr:1-(5-phosphoribosyl)-5-[(5-phosphoribosylamino)methylideneamino] imidazole-4-carboxamide isomerase [Paracoccaceae bacterium]
NADIDGLEVATSEVSTVAKATRAPVIASGLVRGLDDVSVLKYAGQVSGVVIGRALFNRAVDLKEALAVAAPQAEKVAEFI